ncbi:hypothetical protein DPMN_184350 [Dreissena polymorpha]|uniref:Uncharacterized protein n=1 Tax=Dreissena polymorpha TaxID=45954 RepID=A0A9D4DJV2_DREPO|nr:hypothetical protein DPMN_184350 [Dreissena polymorpha]
MRLYFRSCSKGILIEETNKYLTADINKFLSNIQKIQEELKELKGRAECNLHSLEKAYERIKKEIDASVNFFYSFRKMSTEDKGL